MRQMKTDALLKLQNKTAEGRHGIALLLLGKRRVWRLICTQTNAIKCKEKCKQCGKAFATLHNTNLHEHALTEALISSGGISQTNNNIRSK